MLISQTLKRVAASLPASWQQELKRAYFARQIRANSFSTNEIEFELMRDWLRPGDWAIDVGANIGHYTKRMSELVGPQGRVFAFEPMAATFDLLSSNTARFKLDNVSLLNFAASDSSQLVHMDLPNFDSGASNYYQAHITANGTGKAVMSVRIDALELPKPVRMVKIDAEGHEPAVLLGMQQLIARDRPIIVLEFSSDGPEQFLAARGYRRTYLEGSSNLIFQHASEPPIPLDGAARRS